MWPFRSWVIVTIGDLERRLLKAGVQPGSARISDAAERDRAFEQFGRVRRDLFEKHAASLSRGERWLFAHGQHPSQNSDSAHAAEVASVVQELQCFLQKAGVVAEVAAALYHFDRTILTVTLNRDPGSSFVDLPWLFRGYEVKYHWPPSIPAELL